MFVRQQLKLNIKNLKFFFRKFSETNLINKLNKIFPNYHIIFTDSGRSAFQLAIKELCLENSEMLVPAYLCDIFLPIFEHYHIKPIYLDINLKTFHADFSDPESKITPNTKSILICHTYGLAAKMDKVLEIAKKYNLKIIEDCAHLSIGLPRASEAGRGGDCAFFSFAKLFPVVNGGMLVFRGATPKSQLEGSTFKFSDLVKFLRLFPFMAHTSEKFRRSYERNNKLTSPTKPFRRSLKIFSWYLDNTEEQTSKRVELAEYFHKKLQKIGFQSSGITYISALVPKNINRDELFYKLRKKNIFCSRIWHKPIILDREKYPNSYEAAQRIINFPLQNWFTEKDIDKIIKIILLCGISDR